MKTEIQTIHQFIKSLSPGQRRFFVQREADNQTRLQNGLREFGRGLGEISALNGDALAIVLAAGVHLPSQKPAGK